jgi:HAD superfamily hydrolase (TIGR01509 family)
MFKSSVDQFVSKSGYPGFKIKAVFFDMDGVLFDSMKFHADAWVKAMNDIKIPFTHYEAYMNEGRTGHSTIDGAFMKNVGRTATEEEKQEIYRLKSNHFEAYGPSETMPFASELLDMVRNQGLQIFLVTGSGQPTLIDSLQVHFPGVFIKERMVTAFDVVQGKPFPEPYLKALKKSRMQPWEVVVVENAPLGVQSAVAAGLFTIAVNTGPLESSVLAHSGANIVLDGGMKELHQVWEQISTIQL